VVRRREGVEYKVRTTLSGDCRKMKGERHWSTEGTTKKEGGWGGWGGKLPGVHNG